MRVLIDSHSYLWALFDDKRLSTRAKKILHADENELFFSIASLWELSIKIRARGIPGVGSSIAFLRDSLQEDGITILPVRYEDILAMEELPSLHRDPFDRMLLAQAKSNSLRLLTADGDIRRYPGVQFVG